VRFDLRIMKQREWLLENADWAGGYLYQRGWQAIEYIVHCTQVHLLFLNHDSP
jgi:hypothetical protein